MSLPKGWYSVAGDPDGTQRYWDGEEFTTSPQRNPNARRHGFLAPASTAKWRMAGPIVRAVAGFVDYAGTAVLLVGIGNATGLGIPGPNADEWVAEQNLLLALAGWIMINHVILVGFFGVTLGKILLGLRVVDQRTKSRPPGFARALLRQILLVPGIVISPVLWLLGRRDGFHDVIAGTSVVYA